MTKYFPLLLLIIIPVLSCVSEGSMKDNDFITIFEQSDGMQTATYQQAIAFYKTLSRAYTTIDFKNYGPTDSGHPLNVVFFNPDGLFDVGQIRKTKRILLINNGIHPGEPDGIDACMMLLRDLASGIIPPPKNTVVAVIPIYNIGGSLNRNSTSRTNQNGPRDYGFRGNAMNYDLNRDFIKSDTQNTRSFAQIFHTLNPDVFVDTHVSNGADYQYTVTHLFTQHNKLGGDLGGFLHRTMQPELEHVMSNKKVPMTPYVNVFNSPPDNGFEQFIDSPRYSTGYSTLFHSLGLMVETHMLKPYKQRVEGTYELLKTIAEFTDAHHLEIKSLRDQAQTSYRPGTYYPLHWTVDSTQKTDLDFKGYEAQYIPSNITGQNRLKYDQSKPVSFPVDYYNYFEPTDSVLIPKAYIVPQGWHKVIDLLNLNGITMMSFEKDTTLTVEVYHIDQFNTRNTPYEGHYPHYDTSVSTSSKTIIFRAGDVFVETAQPNVRYLLETLEPRAPDSFFNWNFFDTILQQKEHFSPYVWEDKAQQLLATNPQVQIDFNLKKTFDKDFANSWYAQLDWLHKQSAHYEEAHLTYPVFRILD